MRSAKKIALGGVFAALATALLLLGGVIPAAVFVCPMLASLLLTVLLPRLGPRLCLAWYAAVALLALLLCPDKECAGLFAALGYYPIVRPALQKLPGLLRVGCKLLLFFCAVAALYAVLLLLFRVPSVTEEFGSLTLWMGLVFGVLGTLTFLLFDAVLGRLEPRLRKRFGKST